MKTDKIYIRNSMYTLILFWSTFLFNITTLKFIWEVEIFSRVVNSLVLLSSVIYLILFFLNYKFPKYVFYKYLLPGILIVLGSSINLLYHSFGNTNLLAQLGSLISWFIFLIIPYLYDKNMINAVFLWRNAYYLMSLITILALIEYYSILHLSYNTDVINTPYGVYLSGNFSILHMLPDGSPHFRLYGCFSEPGSFGMMLLPFITYAYIQKRYLGLLILMMGFYFTYSLGGYFGLLLIVIILYFHKTKKINILIPLFVFSIFTLFVYQDLFDVFSSNYQNKGNSAIIREENFLNGLINIPLVMFYYPLGLPLFESTAESLSNNLYSGSNFIPLNYLYKGGIVCFIGYLMILVNSTYIATKIITSKINLPVEYIVSAISIIVMLPYMVQRGTIFETPLFALLFGPVLLNSIYQKK
jgi:hypothetical protein